MQLIKKRFYLIFMAVFLALLALLPGVALAENDPTAEPVVSTIADKLIIQLGPEWAGTEFSLTTDMGVYPGVITVNEAGILTTELGGSSTYMLVCVTYPVMQTETEPASPEAEPVHQPSEHQGEPESIPPTSETPEEDAVQEQPPQQESQQPTLAPVPEEQDGIPTLHIVLFIGGAVLCVVGLIVIRILKHRNDYYDEEDE